jgi:N-acetylglucosamine malate deacetylase 1
MMNVLAISAHPDDETLGCGGSLLRHASDGDKLHWLILTRAFTPNWTQEVVDRESTEVAQVAESYGMCSVHREDFRTMSLDSIPVSNLIDAVRAAIEASRPQIVYLPHFGDVHTDHGAVFTATMSVLKSFYMHKFGVQQVLSFETLSSTEAAPPHTYRSFLPTVYRNISPHLERKIQIMSMYSTEEQPDLYPRGASAIRALARYRGSTIGVEYAEAFSLIRQVL